jgi:hypothetical protein
VVLYGCETWFLLLKEGHRLKVIENKVLRRIFRPKWDETIVDWRKLHSDELRIIKSRRTEWSGLVTRMEEKRNMHRVLVGKTEGKRLLGKNSRSNKRDHREVGWGGMDWIGLTQDREKWRALVNAAINLRVP